MSSFPEREPENFKIIVDYLKHITTLSTGSILIIATFIEKLFQNPVWKPAVVTSLLCFMLSVLSASVVYTLSVLFAAPADTDEVPTRVNNIGLVFSWLTWLGFPIGIVALTFFTIANIVQ